jgi:hypothetical protein
MAIRVDTLHSEGKASLTAWQQAKGQLAWALEQAVPHICERMVERKLLEVERQIADLRVEVMGDV